MFNYISERCCVCDVRFQVTDTLYRDRKDNLKSFWCPNGHELTYKKSTSDELREKLTAVTKENGELLMRKIELENKLERHRCRKVGGRIAK